MWRGEGKQARGTLISSYKASVIMFSVRGTMTRIGPKQCNTLCNRVKPNQMHPGYKVGSSVSFCFLTDIFTCRRRGHFLPWSVPASTKTRENRVYRQRKENGMYTLSLYRLGGWEDSTYFVFCAGSLLYSQALSPPLARTQYTGLLSRASPPPCFVGPYDRIQSISHAVLVNPQHGLYFEKYCSRYLWRT